VGAAADGAPSLTGAPDAPAAGGGARARRRRRAGAAALVAAAVALVGLRAVVAEPFRIPSGSMAPTLVPGDSVLVDKTAYRRGPPGTGDLVAFHAPGSGEVLLKRIVALGGQTVGLADGVLVVDGRRRHEPYADPQAIDSVYFGPVRVPHGTVFVMGDDRGDSVDSRQFGPVARDRIIGRVVARIWPPSRWGTPG
jgi:signal peptidase I